MQYPGAKIEDYTGIKLGQLISFLQEVAEQEGDDCKLGSPGSGGDSNLYRVKIGGRRGGKSFSLWMDEGYDSNDQVDQDDGLLVKKKPVKKQKAKKAMTKPKATPVTVPTTVAAPTTVAVTISALAHVKPIVYTAENLRRSPRIAANKVVTPSNTINYTTENHHHSDCITKPPTNKKVCGHNCYLSFTKNCCACTDCRPIDNYYKYVDGGSYKKVSRSEDYCSCCRK